MGKGKKGTGTRKNKNNNSTPEPICNGSNCSAMISDNNSKRGTRKNKNSKSNTETVKPIYNSKKSNKTNSPGELVNSDNCHAILSRPNWTWELVVCFAWGIFPYITTRRKFVSQGYNEHDIFFKNLTPEQKRKLNKNTLHNHISALFE